MNHSQNASSDPRALDRIRKLLRLGASPNAAESASAIAKAQALMDEMNISAAMLDAETSGPTEDARAIPDPLDALSRLPQWRGTLAVYLSRATGCFVWSNSGRLMIYGRPSDAANCRYLYSFCVDEIDALTRAHTAGCGRVYAANFRRGCVDAIRDAIATERAASRDAMTQIASSQGGNALVVLQNAIAVVDNRAAIAEQGASAQFRLRSCRASRTRGDYGAREAGRAAGAGIYGAASGQRRVGGPQ